MDQIQVKLVVGTSQNVTVEFLVMVPEATGWLSVGTFSLTPSEWAKMLPRIPPEWQMESARFSRDPMPQTHVDNVQPTDVIDAVEYDESGEMHVVSHPEDQENP